MESIPSNGPPTTTKVDLMKGTRRPQNWVMVRLSLDSTPRKLIKLPGAFNCAEFLEEENTEVELTSWKIPNEKAVYDSSTADSTGFPSVTITPKKIPEESLKLASGSIVNETGSSNSISEDSLSNIPVTPGSIPSNCPSTSKKDDLTERTQTRKYDLIERTRTKKDDLWMRAIMPPYSTSGKLVAQLYRPKIGILRWTIPSGPNDSITITRFGPEKILESASDSIVNGTVSSNSISEGSLSNIQTTPDLRGAKKRKYPRHFDDFCEEHVQTPEGAARALKVGKKCVAKLRKKRDSLKSKNSELKKRVEALEQALGEQKNVNEKLPTSTL